MFGCMNRSSCLAPHPSFHTSPSCTPFPLSIPDTPHLSAWACLTPGYHMCTITAPPLLFSNPTPQVKHIPCQTHTQPPSFHRVWVHEHNLLSCTPFCVSIPDTPHLSAPACLMPGGHMCTICTPPQPMAQSNSSSPVHSMPPTHSATILLSCLGA